jgi:hypothetical protein
LWYGGDFYEASRHISAQFDMEHLVCTPDLGVALPPEGMPYPLLKERAQAACATIDLLLGAGLDPQLLIPKPEDQDIAASVVEAFAQDEEKASQSLTTHKISTMTPASLLLVKSTLDEFGHAVVERATQIRHLVTNKLVLESENPDPKIRIRALELLGKISDVGLFTERSEVVITARSTEELKQTLRDKFNKLRAKMDVVDVEMVQPVQTINLDEELGIPAPSNAEFDANSLKTVEEGVRN